MSVIEKKLVRAMEEMPEAIRKVVECEHEWVNLSPPGAWYRHEKCRHCKATRMTKVESNTP